MSKNLGSLVLCALRLAGLPSLQSAFGTGLYCRNVLDGHLRRTPRSEHTGETKKYYCRALCSVRLFVEKRRTTPAVQWISKDYSNFTTLFSSHRRERSLFLSLSPPCHLCRTTALASSFRQIDKQGWAWLPAVRALLCDLSAFPAGKMVVE